MSLTIDPAELQATRDAARKSWLASANDAHCDFPIQNLPFGIFSDTRNATPRAGVAIGDSIVDLAALAEAGKLTLAQGGDVFAQPALNPFIALGRDAWRSVRIQLSTLLEAGCPTLRDDAALRARVLVAAADATLHLPVDIPGYTDFYSSKEHATNVGSMFRDPKNALLPNWLEMPVG
jgi:fumarylacetoacetase